MRTEKTRRVELPSQDAARAIVERARQLRAEALARMLRAAWARVAARPAGVQAGDMRARA